MCACRGSGTRPHNYSPRKPRIRPRAGCRSSRASNRGVSARITARAEAKLKHPTALGAQEEQSFSEPGQAAQRLTLGPISRSHRSHRSDAVSASRVRGAWRTTARAEAKHPAALRAQERHSFCKPGQRRLAPRLRASKLKPSAWPHTGRALAKGAAEFLRTGPDEPACKAARG